MKAVLCKALGPAGDLVIEEIDDPKVGKGQVLVDIRAAGLNFPDTLIIAGKYQAQPPLPFIPGGEGAGVVAAVGEGVDTLKVGDKIIFNSMIGAFAEKIAVPAAMCTPMPEGMPFEVGAGFTVTYATSYHALKQRAQLQKGETVLVLGAAGGVGLATIELAKAMGAKVIAAASTDEKLEVCKKAGADILLNYTTEDMKARLKELGGADVVYDPVGGDYTEVALRSLRPGGRLLVIGFAAGDIPKIPINLCLVKQTSIVGVFWGAWATANPKLHRQNMIDMFEMFKNGIIDPLVNDVFTYQEVADAYACLTERRARGKVILKP